MTADALVIVVLSRNPSRVILRAAFALVLRVGPAEANRNRVHNQLHMPK